MEIERRVLKELLNWKTTSGRKPLILREARQVGKTTLIHQFAKSCKNKILLNLEITKDRRIFTDFDHVKNVVESLFISHNIPTSEKRDTLIFIDEIQESPKAISMLRYFYEKEPYIHVVAARSLLEHTMRKVNSFPVGRVNMLYLFPINFPEFLGANIKTAALDQFNTILINEVAHQTLVDLFNRFAIIGGMPEVVS